MASLMESIQELKRNIAASLFISPCTFEELESRDFLVNIAQVDRLIMLLENDKAIYYKGDVIHTNKAWAKRNLQEYELDFRTEREKELDGMSDFKKSVYGL